MSDQKLPAYLKENADNSMTVDLSRGVDVDGTKAMKLTLREPAVSDMLAAKEMGSNSADGEVILISNLAEVPPEVIQSAKMRDYSRLQEALDFLNG